MWYVDIILKLKIVNTILKLNLREERMLRLVPGNVQESCRGIEIYTQLTPQKEEGAERFSLT